MNDFQENVGLILDVIRNEVTIFFRIIIICLFIYLYLISSSLNGIYTWKSEIAGMANILNSNKTVH